MRNFSAYFFIFAAILIFIQCQNNNDGMLIEKNKEIAIRFYNDVLNNGALELLDDIMSGDFIDHNAGPGQLRGIGAFKDFLKRITTAFPDLQIKIEDVLADGNKVTARLSITGTQTGPLGTIPASNIKANWTGIDILEIENGKIISRWSERNLLGLMKQIGVIPDN